MIDFIEAGKYRLYLHAHTYTYDLPETSFLGVFKDGSILNLEEIFNDQCVIHNIDNFSNDYEYVDFNLYVVNEDIEYVPFLYNRYVLNANENNMRIEVSFDCTASQAYISKVMTAIVKYHFEHCIRADIRKIILNEPLFSIDLAHANVDLLISGIPMKITEKTNLEDINTLQDINDANQHLCTCLEKPNSYKKEDIDRFKDIVSNIEDNIIKRGNRRNNRNDSDFFDISIPI